MSRIPLSMAIFALAGCSGITGDSGDGGGRGGVSGGSAGATGGSSAGGAGGSAGGSLGGVQGGSGGGQGGGATGALPRPFDEGVTYQRELYVSMSGNDASDGSIGMPLATLRAALQRATPGTRVNVLPGTYAGAGYFSGLTGQANAPIALSGQPGAIIDGLGTEISMSLGAPQYLVIEGLTIRNTFPHGMNIDDTGNETTPANHIVLRNLTITNVGTGGNSDCLKLSGVDNFFVLGSDISRCNQGEAIDMVGCHSGVIAGNTFHDIVINAVQTKGGSADTLIHGNRFIDVAERAINAGGSTGAPYFRPRNAGFEAARIQIVANTFLRTASAAVAFVGCDTCVAANNTIIDPRGYVTRILEENTTVGPGVNGVFINNVVVFNLRSLNGIIGTGPSTQPSTYTFGSNLWFALDTPNYGGPNWSGSGVPAETDGVVQQDPQLVDRLGGDYHLRSTSPARGRGRTVPRGGRVDFDGRTWATPPAVGAFEAP